MMKIRIYNTFAFKLSASIISCLVIVLIVILVHNYKLAKNIILENNSAQIGNLQEATLKHIDIFLSVTEQAVNDLAGLLEYTEPTEPELKEMMTYLIHNVDINHNITIFFEPNMLENKSTNCGLEKRIFL